MVIPSTIYLAGCNKLKNYKPQGLLKILTKLCTVPNVRQLKSRVNLVHRVYSRRIIRRKNVFFSPSFQFLAMEKRKKIWYN